MKSWQVLHLKHMESLDLEFAKSDFDQVAPQMLRIDHEVRPLQSTLDDNFPDAHDTEDEIVTRLV